MVGVLLAFFRGKGRKRGCEIILVVSVNTARFWSLSPGVVLCCVVCWHKKKLKYALASSSTYQFVAQEQMLQSIFFSFI